MNAATAYLLLVLAAVLEAAGDAIVRTGLNNQNTASKLVLFVVGGFVLFGYGVVVNSPPWNFGRLLGVYVTLFFLAAQIINLVFFGVRPDVPIMIGGALILCGGLVITFWRA